MRGQFSEHFRVRDGEAIFLNFLTQSKRHECTAFLFPADHLWPPNGAKVCLGYNGGGGGTRTPTPLRTTDFKSVANGVKSMFLLSIL